jgi:hypothetical protein
VRKANAQTRREIAAAKKEVRAAKKEAKVRGGQRGGKKARKTTRQKFWEKRLERLGNRTGPLKLDAAQQDLAQRKARVKQLQARPQRISQTKGSGKPLVPRGTSSRAISRAQTDSGRTGPHTWESVIFWQDFTSADGREILAMHANPVNAPYPRRDVIAQPRPSTTEKFVRRAREYVQNLLRAR